MVLKIKPTSDNALSKHFDLCLDVSEKEQKVFKQRWDVKLSNDMLPFMWGSAVVAACSTVFPNAFTIPCVETALAVNMVGLIPLTTSFVKHLGLYYRWNRYSQAAYNDLKIMEQRIVCRKLLHNYFKMSSPKNKKECVIQLRQELGVQKKLIQHAISFEEKHLRKQHQSVKICRFAGRQRD